MPSNASKYAASNLYAVLEPPLFLAHAECAKVEYHSDGYNPWTSEGVEFEEEALAGCAVCTVQPECLEWAITSKVLFVTVGGLTSKAIKRLAKDRRDSELAAKNG